MSDISPDWFTEIERIVTAVGVIATAASSIMNRLALDRLHKENQDISKETVKKVEEVKQAALAVNAEVVEKVHQAGVEAGKELAANGKDNGGTH